ncbi:serine hydrolase [Jiangella ureilytica]|uniref:Serine hydrolase n=1 Tax=Jiangella ureilytica TaxID=2530374 RepID=A0A4R4RTF7_9ACTN|nr:serine hydrolase [Jiangella ureilytica]TDC53270.1 serine hydrolase [Jiangella ureilytica]
MGTTTLTGLDEHVEQALHDWGIPGAAVAVVHGTDVLHVGGHGVKEAGSDDRVDEHTLFQLGSTSKAFTAAAAGVLVDEGRLGWDDPLAAHLPGFRLHDPWLTRAVTVRDALAHRTGHVDVWAPGLEIMGADEALRRMRYQRQAEPFRASYVYSNLMYGAVGQVVEAVSGTTWQELVRTRIFEPLGMTRSGTSALDYWDDKHVTATFFGTAPAGEVRRTEAHDGNVAMPHRLGGGPARSMPWQSYDTLAAAGAVVSSAADLSNWLVMQLNDGRPILRRDTLREMHSPQNPHDTARFPFENTTHALGWRNERYRGETHVSHGGLIIGFPAQVSLLPDRRLGVAVLANGDRASFDRTAHGYDPFAFHTAVSLWVFDQLLGRPLTGWSAELATRQRAAQRAHDEEAAALTAARLSGTRPTLAVDRYAGDYEDHHRLYGRLRITADDDGLLLAFPGAGAFAARLEHWHGDVFRIRPLGVPYVRPFARFAVGPRGSVEALSILDADFRPAS